MSVHTDQPQPLYPTWERLLAGLIIVIIAGFVGWGIGAAIQHAPWVPALIALIAFLVLVGNRWIKSRGEWETLA